MGGARAPEVRVRLKTIAAQTSQALFTRQRLGDPMPTIAVRRNAQIALPTMPGRPVAPRETDPRPGRGTDHPALLQLLPADDMPRPYVPAPDILPDAALGAFCG